MAVQLTENWQEGKTLQECNLFLLENEYSDVIFRLHYKNANKEEEVADIHALRTLCLARSPVFFAMFAGELAQQSDNPIHEIHDDYADPEAFKQLVRYMYSDNVMLTADNVLPILYLAKKYIVSALTHECIDYLEQNLTSSTAAVVLEQSMLYEEKELKAKTLTTIQEEAPAVLASDEFLDLSKEALGEVLKLNLKVETEVTVFEACIKWAKNQCEKLNKSPSGENIREILGNNLYEIRFPTMSPAEFSDVVVPEKVLTIEEGFEVFRYLVSESNEQLNLPFKVTSRLESEPCIEVHPSLQETKTFPFIREGFILKSKETKSLVTDLSCTISKPLCIESILIHPNAPNSAKIEYQVTVMIEQHGECLYESTGEPDAIMSGKRVEYYAFDVDDVQVESGAMELSITLTLTNNDSYSWSGVYKFSSLETCDLADDDDTISFPPVEKNLLFDICYRIP